MSVYENKLKLLYLFRWKYSGVDNITSNLIKQSLIESWYHTTYTITKFKHIPQQKMCELFKIQRTTKNKREERNNRKKEKRRNW